MEPGLLAASRLWLTAILKTGKEVCMERSFFTLTDESFLTKQMNLEHLLSQIHKGKGTGIYEKCWPPKN